ncbi:aminoacylase-1A-like isoform X1 [Drosophila elegans]|uniref:aminoacylase-1A-like isoform X1 n=1 Tax=Drosophila elegans TaxID=30023 RepID=UPI001BC85027|nr:aminoacylase-1A-like isoform X1 [Drosophila elegans]XP_041565456.1 aminoacylase-1A-like isoform X1 [Drosophila elegans]XP_041565457.1 aminoacylase-1A-like isoform X1 [Drosophila elegans]
MTAANWDSNKEIQYFREYLRIPSVHPNPNYEPCVEFLKRQAEDLDLPIKVYYPLNEQNPVVVLTWEGLENELPSILLNSHMDVVPVFPENWTHSPFAADIDEDGRIFARGSQDMKCVGMQYLAAIRALKKSGSRFKRTIHISFVPDEEVGGRKGMYPFVTSEDFKSLNIGFSLDEGIASPTSVFPVFYAERTVKRKWKGNLWQALMNLSIFPGVILKISGSAGHGLLLMPNTAGEKLSYITDKMMQFRAGQVKRLKDNPELQVGDVTTINLTTVDGGVQSNVVPPLLTVCFDVRLSLDIDVEEFEANLAKWCEEAGGGIELEFSSIWRKGHIPPTVTDKTNPFWVAFKRATDELGLSTKLQVFPGGTDSRYIRHVGIPALGFSPMNNTPVLLHDHDEFLHAETYLQGVEIYKKIIVNLANV